MLDGLRHVLGFAQDVLVLDLCIFRFRLVSLLLEMSHLTEEQLQITVRLGEFLVELLDGGPVGIRPLPSGHAGAPHVVPETRVLQSANPTFSLFRVFCLRENKNNKT